MLLTTLFSVAALLAVGHAAPVEKRQGPAGVPDFVTKYAPVVYLHSKEQWFPTDLQTFLTNTVPQVAWKTISGPNPLTLDNVNQLGDNVWLTSKDDVTKNPAWLKGTKPDGSGKTNNAITASVIVNDKGNGIVDAFYMYFYAYNYGGNVLGIKKLNFGNHVGDFEHNMIRFEHGVPQWIWYSQHGNGQAFRYTTAQKHAGGPRPIVYSSSGSHANYAIPGKHDHLIPNFNLPGGALEDDTNAGTLWDPLLSAYWYSYNAGKGEFKPYDASGKTPVNWLYFKGKWGDEEYQKGDKRQVKLFGHAKFSGGPTGPANKQLDRKEVCPQNGNKCILRTILVPRRVGDEEDDEV